jgi:hypothetical protein
MSDAVRMLPLRVAAEKALPFDVRVPNATTVKAMRAARKGKGKRMDSANALFKRELLTHHDNDPAHKMKHFADSPKAPCPVCRGFRRRQTRETLDKMMNGRKTGSTGREPRAGGRKKRLGRAMVAAAFGFGKDVVCRNLQRQEKRA